MVTGAHQTPLEANAVQARMSGGAHRTRCSKGRYVSTTTSCALLPGKLLPSGRKSAESAGNVTVYRHAGCQESSSDRQRCAYKQAKQSFASWLLGTMSSEARLCPAPIGAHPALLATVPVPVRRASLRAGGWRFTPDCRPRAAPHVFGRTCSGLCRAYVVRLRGSYDVAAIQALPTVFVACQTKMGDYIIITKECVYMCSLNSTLAVLSLATRATLLGPTIPRIKSSADALHSRTLQMLCSRPCWASNRKQVPTCLHGTLPLTVGAFLTPDVMREGSVILPVVVQQIRHARVFQEQITVEIASRGVRDAVKLLERCFEKDVRGQAHTSLVGKGPLYRDTWSQGYT